MHLGRQNQSLCDGPLYDTSHHNVILTTPMLVFIFSRAEYKSKHASEVEMHKLENLPAAHIKFEPGSIPLSRLTADKFMYFPL